MSLPEPTDGVSPDRLRTWMRRITGGLLLGYWPLLFTATHLPIDPQRLVPGNDKTLHFIGYAALAFLCGAWLDARAGANGFQKPAQPETFYRWARFPYVGALLLLTVYGGIDECTQPFVGRFCDFHDWLADVGGIVIGLTITQGVSRFFFTMNRP